MDRRCRKFNSPTKAAELRIELVRRMSQISGATYPIYAPLMLDDPAAAQSLRSQAKVAMQDPEDIEFCLA